MTIEGISQEYLRTFLEMNFTLIPGNKNIPALYSYHIKVLSSFGTRPEERIFHGMMQNSWVELLPCGNISLHLTENRNFGLDTLIGNEADFRRPLSVSET